jgi:hypothetical protein
MRWISGVPARGGGLDDVVVSRAGWTTERRTRRQRTLGGSNLHPGITPPKVHEHLRAGAFAGVASQAETRSEGATLARVRGPSKDFDPGINDVACAG